ncbi:MAG: 30S ribosomal protein S9 [Candidatus Buchananbacteria bacterium]
MPRKKKAELEQEEQDTQKKRVRHSYLYAVGRRKKSVARVRLFKKGEGKITVNEKDCKKYFPTDELQRIILQPLEVLGKQKEFDFTIKVAGGGSHGQAEACRHGISRALIVFDKDLRKVIKPHGFLTRDPRRRERKKPGLKRARRAPQWAKR